MLSPLTECPDCEGQGDIVTEYGTIKQCPRCKGKGYVDEIFDLKAGDYFPAEEERG